MCQGTRSSLNPRTQKKYVMTNPSAAPPKVCRKKQRIVFSPPPLRVAAKKLRAIGWGWVLRNKFFNEFPLFCQRPESLTAAQQRCLNQLGALPPAPCERAQQVFQVFLPPISHAPPSGCVNKRCVPHLSSATSRSNPILSRTHPKHPAPFLTLRDPQRTLRAPSKFL